MATDHYFPTRALPLGELPSATALDGPNDPQRLMQPDEMVTMDRSLGDRAETVGRVEQARWRVSGHEMALDDLSQRLRTNRREYENQSARLDRESGRGELDEQQRAVLQAVLARIAQQVAHDCALLVQEAAALRRVREQEQRASGTTDTFGATHQARRTDEAVEQAQEALALVAAGPPSTEQPANEPPAPGESEQPQAAPPVADWETEKVAELVSRLDELGVPPEATRAQYRAQLADAGVRVGDHRLAEAIRVRKERGVPATI